MSFFKRTKVRLLLFVLIFIFSSSIFVFAADDEEEKDKSSVSLGYLYSNWSTDKLEIDDDIDFDQRYGTIVFDFEYSATAKFGFGASYRVSEVDQDWNGIPQNHRDYYASNMLIGEGGGEYSLWEGRADEFNAWVPNTPEFNNSLALFFDDYEGTMTRNSIDVFMSYKLHDYLKIYFGIYYLRYDYFSFFEYPGWQSDTPFDKEIFVRIEDTDYFAKGLGYYERQNRFAGPRLTLRSTLPIGEHTGFYGDIKVSYAQMWRMNSTHPLKSKIYSQNPKYYNKRILPFERPVDYLIKYEIERPGNRQAYQIDGSVGLIYHLSALHPKLPVVISAYYEFCKLYMTDYTANSSVKDIVFGDNPQETMHNFVFKIGYEW